MRFPFLKPWLLSSALGLSLGACTSCVARGARVRTPNGRRRIEDLAVGDWVLSLDPETGELVPGPITAIRSARREVMLLSAAGHDLRVTTDHPLYCPDEKRYAPAGDWALGQRTALLCLVEDAPTVVSVDRVDVAGGIAEVFDLTVDTPLHNFLADGVLVHNKSFPMDYGPDDLGVPDAGPVQVDEGPEDAGPPEEDQGVGG